MHVCALFCSSLDWLVFKCYIFLMGKFNKCFFYHVFMLIKQFYCSVIDLSELRRLVFKMSPNIDFNENLNVCVHIQFLNLSSSSGLLFFFFSQEKQLKRRKCKSLHLTSTLSKRNNWVEIAMSFVFHKMSFFFFLNIGKKKIFAHLNIFHRHGRWYFSQCIRQ